MLRLKGGARSLEFSLGKLKSAHTQYVVVLDLNFVGGKKRNFYYDSRLKSKKFQIAQIFSVSIVDINKYWSDE